MDQDMPHRISAPSKAAPGPRYSLVWKLVFWPRDQYSGTDADAQNGAGAQSDAAAQHGGGGGGEPAGGGGGGEAAAALGLSRPEWGPPQRIGSAAASVGGRRLPAPIAWPL